MITSHNHSRGRSKRRAATESAAAPSLGQDLIHALDAVAFAEDRLGFHPDTWQSRLLRSRSKQIVLNCCRQSGKSTTTSIVALHTALYTPASLILLISPTAYSGGSRPPIPE